MNVLTGAGLGSPAPFNFWDSLTPIEQNALTSVAKRRTFPPKTPIFREGEPADHVVLIQSGWTKISVRENGQERLLAERGPGQLVGERASLQPSVRSASVTALDKVDALVLPTPVFESFISAHPRALGILENQIYERLTQEPGRPAHDDRRADVDPPRLNGQNCTILTTDIAQFNAPIRTADDRVHIQQQSHAMTYEALVHAGIPWEACHRRDQGDGLLVVVPPAIPSATVITALDRLAAELRSYNRRAAPAVQIRLKVALHVGPVTTNRFGLAGEALIHAARLLGAAKLKRAMADEPGAPLGVIASSTIYDTVIKDLDVDGYYQVRCKVKESRIVAWMRLTDPPPRIP